MRAYFLTNTLSYQKQPYLPKVGHGIMGLGPTNICLPYLSKQILLFIFVEQYRTSVWRDQ